MAKRELSILQKAYKEFFLAILVEYSVNSPASLNYEHKREFFTKIKEGWKIRKAELIKNKVKQSPASKKEGYSKIKLLRPSIPLEPIEEPKESSSIKSEVVLEEILSEPSPEQTDDLIIKFNPNDFFEQEDLIYKYPVVKMPREGAFLKLPRKGRAQGKGSKEQDFYNAILARIPEIEVAIDLHMAIPFFNRPY